MEFTAINPFAVFVAALSSFLVGGVWYSPLLFATPWMEDNRLSADELKNANMTKIFGGSFVLALIIAGSFSYVMGSAATMSLGLRVAAIASVGWVAASLGLVYLFERKPLRLYAINTGYQVVTYVLMGVIIGAWQ